jgi:serine phosphatase RsbU (regulator of sigma subunit)
MALGDVSGKGTGAALLMTVLRAAVRGHWADESVAEAVGRINSTVCQNVTAGKYITFFLARLDPCPVASTTSTPGTIRRRSSARDGTIETSTRGDGAGALE